MHARRQSLLSDDFLAQTPQLRSAHDFNEIAQLLSHFVLGRNSLRDLRLYRIAKPLSQAMDRNLHRAVAQSKSRPRFGLAHAGGISGEPWFQHFELIGHSLLVVFDREGSECTIEHGEAPLPIKERVRSLSFRDGVFIAGRWFSARNQRHMFMLCATLGRAETITRVGKVMLHCAEEVSPEPALLPLRPRDHATREQAREKLLREIVRVAEIMRRARDVALHGRIVSLAQFRQGPASRRE